MSSAVLGAGAALFAMMGGALLMSGGFRWNLFSFHPLLMWIGCVMCSTTAIASFVNRRHAPTAEKKTGLIQKHVWLNSFGFLCILFGSAAIWINKERHGKPHLATWHSWIGLLAILSYAGNVAGVRRSLCICLFASFTVVG